MNKSLDMFTPTGDIKIFTQLNNKTKIALKCVADAVNVTKGILSDPSIIKLTMVKDKVWITFLIDGEFHHDELRDVCKRIASEIENGVSVEQFRNDWLD